MATQAEFDAKIDLANETLATIADDVTNIQEAITAEAAEIAAFIEANPGIDTSALDGVQTRLTAVADNLGTTADSVENIFTPPTE